MCRISLFLELKIYEKHNSDEEMFEVHLFLNHYGIVIGNLN